MVGFEVVLFLALVQKRQQTEGGTENKGTVGWVQHDNHAEMGLWWEGTRF